MQAAFTESGDDKSPATVRVWDPLVRIFHWSLVMLFSVAFVTGEDLIGLHELSGYVVGGLVAFRVVWGLVGPRHARFIDFVRGPDNVIGYLRDAMAMKSKRHLGHNPAGGAMIVLLLVALAGIAMTGYTMTTDAFWGVEWVSETHVFLVYATLGLIALHIAGVVLASVEHGENLVRAMVTGRKRSN